MKILLLPVVILLAYSPFSYAQLHTETVEYTHNDVTLEGYLAYDDRESSWRARGA